MREAFPRIERLLTTVVRVHGNTEPRLRDAQRRFSEIRSELKPHLASEESALFPACIASDQAGAPVEAHVLETHEPEHAALGHALVTLRILCGDYARQAALCNTHRALLDALETFEHDLHRHVHEENNILLPRARRARPTPTAESRSRAARNRAGSGPPSEALSACCEDLDRGADRQLGGSPAEALTRAPVATGATSLRDRTGFVAELAHEVIERRCRKCAPRPRPERQLP
jgi:Hemerythrin HHE cation binding domain